MDDEKKPRERERKTMQYKQITGYTISTGISYVRFLYQILNNSFFMLTLDNTTGITSSSSQDCAQNQIFYILMVLLVQYVCAS